MDNVDERRVSKYEWQSAQRVTGRDQALAMVCKNWSRHPSFPMVEKERSLCTGCDEGLECDAVRAERLLAMMDEETDKSPRVKVEIRRHD